MKMKGGMLYLCIVMLSMFAFACNNHQEEFDSLVPSDMDEIIVKAVLPDGAGSRVTLIPGENEDGNPIVDITWDKEDAFWVLQCVVEGQLFSKTEEGNLFTGTLPVDGQDDFVAFYPPVVQENGQGWRLDEAVPVELDKQTGSLDKNKTYMTAKSADGKSFVFHHLTALLKPSFSGFPSDVNINRIIVGVSKCVNGTLYKGDYPFWDRGGNEITIDYDTPVGQDTDFYIYLPPLEQDKLLMFAVTATDGKIYRGELTLSMEIKEGKLYTADVALTPEEDIPYLTFSADAEQILCMSIPVGHLEYSVNDAEWKELSTWLVTFGGEYGNLRLRGKDYRGTVISENNYVGAQITFKNNDVYVDCSGDIRTLAGYESYKMDKPFASFSGLFKDCTVLKTAPELPSLSLQRSCYERMFSGCTSLTEAPELPATNLESLCYQQMFSGCTSLTKAPELPATNLEYGCYASMFSSCTSLTEAPELPATNLETLCYYNMFMQCTSLTEAPELPAINLKAYCYELMFWGCRRLTKAPVLKAEVLELGCYDDMFAFCSNLTEVTMLATDITAQDCLTNWLRNSSGTSGTFYKSPDMDVSAFLVGDSGIPEGWTVMDYTGN